MARGKRVEIEISPSQYAKSQGLKSLKQASEITEKPIRTLQDWHKDQPTLFRVVIAGCVSLIESKQK